MNLSRVARQVYLVESDTAEELAELFYPYSAYHECPEFHEKLFTRLAYEDWYKHKRPGANGEWTYASDWVGFNVPYSSIRPILNHLRAYQDPYDLRMHEIVEECREESGDNFYLIGVRTGATAVLDHELAHAFYYVSPTYRLAVVQQLEALSHTHPDLRLAMNKMLQAIGYHPSVWVDECQAYLATSTPRGLSKSLKSEAGYTKRILKKDLAPYVDLLKAAKKAHQLPK